MLECWHISAVTTKVFVSSSQAKIPHPEVTPLFSSHKVDCNIYQCRDRHNRSVPSKIPYLGFEGMFKHHSLCIPILRACNLQSEEFFRSISRSGKGVPLNSVNSISTPSFGFLDTCRVIYMRHASLHLLTAFILSFLVLAMSVIASAACQCLLMYTEIWAHDSPLSIGLNGAR